MQKSIISMRKQPKSSHTTQVLGDKARVLTTIYKYTRSTQQTTPPPISRFKKKKKRKRKEKNNSCTCLRDIFVSNWGKLEAVRGEECVTFPLWLRASLSRGICVTCKFIYMQCIRSTRDGYEMNDLTWLGWRR